MSLSEIAQNAHKTLFLAKNHSFNLHYQNIPGKQLPQICSSTSETYILIADYFSQYLEILRLQSTTSQAVVKALKATFSRHGIPEIIISDNGPQYSSEGFSEFAKQYQFTHITSSPYYPASNGLAQRVVQTVKHLLKNAEDPFLALLFYCSTPLPWCGKSPAELLMGRKICNTLPLAKRHLTPEWTYLPQYRKDNDKFKGSQKRDHVRHHGVRSRRPLIPDKTYVWVTSGNRSVPGTTITSANTPRSYIIQTPTGDVRRSRSHLNSRHESNTAATAWEVPPPIQTRSQTGTAIYPPTD